MNSPAIQQLNRAPKPMAQTQQPVAPFSANILTPEGFDFVQRVAKALSSSELVPAIYRQQTVDKFGNATPNPNGFSNTVVAINMANRMNADPLMVMQNMHVIEGRPSWSSKWIIAMVNGSGKFSPLRFDMVTDEHETEVEYMHVEWINKQRNEVPRKIKIKNMSCVAWAIEKATGERVESIKVDMVMAIKEGWYQKKGSKWQTMPDQMLRYRSASFFGNIYAPELLMGLMTVEEAQDIIEGEYEVRNSVPVGSVNVSPAMSAVNPVNDIAVDSDGVIHEEVTPVVEPAVEVQEKAQIVAEAVEGDEVSPEEDHPDAPLHQALMMIISVDSFEELVKVTASARKLVSKNKDWLAQLNEAIQQKESELIQANQQDLLN
jgi:hypothetical protein